MSVDLRLDGNGDLDLFNHELFLVTEVDQVVQHLEIRLKFFLGEWFLDTTKGIPYYDEILIKRYEVSGIESFIKSQIINTPGVTKLISFDLNLIDNRGLRVNFTIEINEEQFSSEVII